MFKARFRKGAYGWKSQPAILSIRRALAEIKGVARKDPVLAADGAVAFLERVSPALEHVDSSSGAIGAAVNNAIWELTPLIADAPADAEMRAGWLERLFEAYLNDEIPYIECLADEWGRLCGSPETASDWADRLMDAARSALGPTDATPGYSRVTAVFLSALYEAGRFDELCELLRCDCLWHYKQWAVRALAAKGQKAEALRLAESCRSPWASDEQIDAMCEEILLSAGLMDEAYARYGLRANRSGTNLSTFRAIAKKYPHKPPGEILADLVKISPGSEGKWFAAAKEAGLYDAALSLAGRSPCDPRTLTRAARDYAEKQPAFAVGAGLLAIHWLTQGHGYDITGIDVWSAYHATMTAAARHGSVTEVKEVKERIRRTVAAETTGERFVTKILGGELGL